MVFCRLKIANMATEISYFDFKNLQHQEQCRLVMTEGEVISDSVNGDLRFVIYRMPYFSVELIYIKRNNQLSGFNIYQGSFTQAFYS